MPKRDKDKAAAAASIGPILVHCIISTDEEEIYNAVDQIRSYDTAEDTNMEITHWSLGKSWGTKTTEHDF